MPSRLRLLSPMPHGTQEWPFPYLQASVSHPFNEDAGPFFFLKLQSLSPKGNVVPSIVKTEKKELPWLSRGLEPSLCSFSETRVTGTDLENLQTSALGLQGWEQGGAWPAHHLVCPQVKEYDSISRLDQWLTTMLLRIKKTIQGDEEDLR